MADRAVLIDGPTDDCVEVKISLAATFLDEYVALRLHVPRLVGRAALQDRGFAVPLPRHAKAREAAGHDRFLQMRFSPRRAAVGRDLDLGDTAAPAPRNAADLINLRSVHLLSRR